MDGQEQLKPVLGISLGQAFSLVTSIKLSFER